MSLLSRLGLARKESPQDRYIRMQRKSGTVCFIHINKCGGTSVEKALELPKIHDTAQERIAKLGQARWDAMLTFTLVRHPYEKVISHYKYRIKTNQTKMGQEPPDLNRWIALSYGEKDPHYYDKPLMFAPCMEWITDAQGHVLVDHILKLEEIDTAWLAFCRGHLGRDVPLGQHNKTNSEDLSAQFDARTKDILDVHFAVDFAQLGYSPR